LLREAGAVEEQRAVSKAPGSLRCRANAQSACQCGGAARPLDRIVSIDQLNRKRTEQVLQAGERASCSLEYDITQECAQVPITGMAKRKPASVLLVPMHPPMYAAARAEHTRLRRVGAACPEFHHAAAARFLDE